VTCSTYSPGSLNVTFVVAFPLKGGAPLPDDGDCSTSGFALSNATVPGPRYFDHVTVTGGRGFAIGALVLLVYFMSSVAQMVSGSGADNEAVRLAASATVAIGPWIVDPF
jgi:hypothetical protein